MLYASFTRESSTMRKLTSDPDFPAWFSEILGKMLISIMNQTEKFTNKPNLETSGRPDTLRGTYVLGVGRVNWVDIHKW